MAKRPMKPSKKQYKKRPAAKRKPEAKRYEASRLRKEREYGFYWYSWLWSAIRPVLIFLCSMLIVVGLLSMGWNKINNKFFMPVEPGSTESVHFSIDKGESVSVISQKLEEQKLVRNKSIFKYMVSLQGLAPRIHYGNYDLSRGMSVGEIIDALTTGDGLSKERKITIIPGWTVEDIAAYLEKEGAIKDKNEFLQLANDPERFINVSATLNEAFASGNLSKRKYAMEGYLAPDTYQVYMDASAEQVLNILLKQTDTVLENVYYENNVVEIVYNEDGEPIEENVPYESPLNEQETIILASIIEKEAAVKSDYAKVSAVFHNRINKGMRLESDATVMYPLGISRMILTEDELNSDTGYNTYKMDGLPAGPICNPSKAALTAALNPSEEYINEGYLYFCAQGGSTKELFFTKTAEAHQEAVAKFRPAWEEMDRQRQNPESSNTQQEEAQ